MKRPKDASGRFIRTPEVQLVCERCGKAYLVPRYIMWQKERRSKHRYCSNKCHGLSQRITIDKETLYELYWHQKLSMTKIAERFRVSAQHVYRKLLEFQIARRNHSEMTKNAWRFPEIRRKFAESGNVFISQHPAWNKGMKCPYAGEKFKDAAFLSRLIRGRRKRPTAPEATFIKIIEDNGLPFEYTGNGQLIIGGKNPDFSDHNGHLVEIFGVYWHDPSEVQARINHYQGHGWKTLVLWENDLKDVPDVIERVKRFVYD